MKIQSGRGSPQKFAGLFMRFGLDRCGGVAITAALAVPVLMLLIGSVIDQSRYFAAKERLQLATDAAALGAAKELSLSDSKRSGLDSIVQASVAAHVRSKSAVGATITTKLSDEPLTVEIVARQDFTPLFGDVFGFNVTNVKVRSVARVVGKPNICVLALDPSENGAISLEKDAHVTGSNCAVYSNSAHSNSIKAKNSSALAATFICSRGGKDGGPGNFSPEPMTDCPAFDDPLVGRPEPQIDACLPANLIPTGFNAAFVPGTYCGGLKLRSGTQAVLAPGIYVIKDGPLVVEDGASLTGTNVGFYFTGAKATFTFEDKTTVSLTAPVDGPMAGLLMFESRSQPQSGVHKLLSNDAPRLLGTIYLSQGELRVDAESPIAEDSAYTAIVARVMRLYGGPHLVLNTNYEKSEVPVPEGIRGAGQPVVLAE
ncbi:MAG: TadE/TadG family type IV pilus assembly protein [Hyphomicrobium sp.]